MTEMQAMEFAADPVAWLALADALEEEAGGVPTWQSRQWRRRAAWGSRLFGWMDNIEGLCKPYLTLENGVWSLGLARGHSRVSYTMTRIAVGGAGRGSMFAARGSYTIAKMAKRGAKEDWWRRKNLFKLTDAAWMGDRLADAPSEPGWSEWSIIAWLERHGYRLYQRNAYLWERAGDRCLFVEHPGGSDWLPINIDRSAVVRVNNNPVLGTLDPGRLMRIFDYQMNPSLGNKKERKKA